MNLPPGELRGYYEAAAGQPWNLTTATGDTQLNTNPGIEDSKMLNLAQQVKLFKFKKPSRKFPGRFNKDISS